VERQSEIWRIYLENYCDKSEWHLKDPITHESIIATRDEIQVWMYHSLYGASLLSVLPLCRILRSTDFRREEIYFDNDRRDVKNGSWQANKIRKYRNNNEARCERWKKYSVIL